jgi:hypothetical protein
VASPHGENPSPTGEDALVLHAADDEAAAALATRLRQAGTPEVTPATDPTLNPADQPHCGRAEHTGPRGRRRVELAKFIVEGPSGTALSAQATAGELLLRWVEHHLRRLGAPPAVRLGPGDALLEEGLLGGVVGEQERTLVGRAGLVGMAEGAEELSAGGVVEVVAVERVGESV